MTGESVLPERLSNRGMLSRPKPPRGALPWDELPAPPTLSMRILVIEDSQRLRTSLQAGLSREGFSVDTAADGPSGLALAMHNPFDLLVLDLMLPGLGGLEVLENLRQARKPFPVLILTAKDTTEEVVQGFEAGADDYLVKPFAFEELVARCRTLVRRNYGRLSSLVTIGELEVDLQARCARRAGRDLKLSARDLRVLDYLTHRLGEVVTREELEDHVYKTSALPNSNAIDSAVCALRRKIDPPEDNPSVIRTVRGVGYVLEGEAP